MDNKTDILTQGMMDVKEMARFLHISIVTLYKLISLGRVPAPVKLGRRTLWPVENVKAWVAEGCPQPQEKKQNE